MGLLKKFNLFTFLIIVTAISFAFRLNNVSDEILAKDQMQAPLIKTAKAEEKSDLEDSNEKPPSNSSMDNTKNMIGSGDSQGHRKKDNKSQKDRYLPTFNGGAFSEEELKVLQSLSVRRKQLDIRSDELSKKEALISVASAEVNKKIAELKSMRTEIELLLGTQEDMQEERLLQLVKIYGSMKPKDAAKILNTLEMRVLLKLMGRMSERKSAPILAVMDPEIARQLTIELAQQRKLPDLP